MERKKPPAVLGPRASRGGARSTRPSPAGGGGGEDMASARRVAAGAGLLSAGGAGGFLLWDYNTCHKMRKWQGWEPNGAAVRFHNLFLAPLWARRLPAAELASFDGRGGRPLYFSAAGRVYDASASEAFRETYGATWAGRDASVALALMSLEERDAGRLDWHCLRPEDRQALRDWRAYFDQRLLDI